MKRAWRLRAQGGRYYAEFTTDDGENWTSTPPGGFASATAAAQLVADMKRGDEAEAALTEDEKRALYEKFAGRHDELEDDTYNADAKRAERLLEWGKFLVERGIVNEGSDDDGSDAGHIRGDVA